MTTDTDIVNEAIQMMGANQPLVTGNAPDFDDSAGGVAARYLYQPAVAFVARQWEWDFGRTYDALALTGQPAPDPWTYEYLYPTAAVQVWQVKPTVIADPNDPRPTTWVRGNTVVNGTQTSVIWTDLASAVAIYHNNPDPNVWDPGFREAVVKLLSAEFAIALAGRPETAAVLMQSAQVTAELARSRDS